MVKEAKAKLVMAAASSLFSLRFRATLLLVVALVARTQMAWSQPSACSTQLNNLSVCAPFVVPGAPDSTPSADCCTALQTIDDACMCSTLRIASRLPSHCNLTPVTCGNLSLSLSFIRTMLDYCLIKLYSVFSVDVNA